MSAVVFAIGNRPGLDEPDALVVAALLGRTRNLAAARAAGRIGDQARRDPDGRDQGEEITLDGDEMMELFALLSTPSATRISSAVNALQRVLGTTLSGG